MKSLIQSVQATAALAWGLFRFKPFDTASSGGRSRERLRRVALTAATSAFARAVSMAAPLITVPLAIGYLGHERYGLWMTVASMIGMFAFADLGLGNGLMTEVSQADGKGDLAEARRCIASALFTLLAVAVVLWSIFALSFPFVPWPRLLNVTSPGLLRESGAVVVVCFTVFAFSLPLSVVQRTQGGLQQGFQSNLWQCAGSLFNVTVILTAVRAHAGLPILVLGVAGVQPVVNLLNGVFFFGVQYPHLRPRLRDFHWPTARRLLGTGFWFFLVSILLAFGVYSDNVVVAQIAGLDKVPLYSVPASLALYLSAVASMLYAPFWAANGEAMARGDVGWVRRNAIRIMRFNIGLTGIAGAIFVLAGPVFLHLWIGPDFSPGRPLFLGMALWALLTSMLGPFFMILNGANAVRIQVLILGVFSLIAILLKVLLTRRIGITGVVWASVVPYACLVLPSVLIVTNRLLKRSEHLGARSAVVSETAPSLPEELMSRSE